MKHTAADRSGPKPRDTTETGRPESDGELPRPARRAGWPPAPACRRIALVLFGLALMLHVSAGAVAFSLGLQLRGAVIFSEITALLGVSVWLALRLGLPVREAFALWPAAAIHFVAAVVAAPPLQLAGGVLQFGILQLWPFEGHRRLLEETMRQLVAIETTGDWLSLFVAGVLVAAVCEEVLFRGLILRLLVRHGGWAVGIIGSAALFSAFHLDPVGFLPRLLVGVWLGLLVWRSGSLLPAVVAHGANNMVALFGVAGTSSSETEPAAIATVGIVAALLFGAILVAYLRATADDPRPGRA